MSCWRRSAPSGARSRTRSASYPARGRRGVRPGVFHPAPQQGGQHGNIRRAGLLLSVAAPWKLAKSSRQEDLQDLATILFVSVQGIRLATALLYPVLPFATAGVWAQLGLGSIEEAAARGDLKLLQWTDLEPGASLGPLGAVFPRADKGLAQKMTDMETPIAPAPAASTPAEPTPAPAAANAAAEQAAAQSAV
jgi:methionyl-tRNA synthetase